MNYCGAFLDALLWLELYLRFHIVWVEEDRFLTNPATIAMKTLRRDWLYIIFKFPLEIFVTPFRSPIGSGTQFQTIYLKVR